MSKPIWQVPADAEGNARFEYKGETIEATYLEEIGGENFTTALFLENNSERFYVWRCEHAKPWPDDVEVTMPRDAARYHELRQTRVSIRRVDARGALSWYVEEFINDGPFKRIMREVVADYVCKGERLGKARLVAWVDPSTRQRLKASARAESHDESRQLELFVEEALAVREINAADQQKRARKQKAKLLPRQQFIQLQLVTTMVLQARMIEDHWTRKPETAAAAKAACSEVLSALAVVTNPQRKSKAA